MSKKEYGYSRSFVAVNAEFIKEELSKQRTLKSIWKELMESKTEEMPYNTFLYNVRNLITARNNVLEHQSHISATKNSEKKPEAKKGINKFEFSSKHNAEEDLI